MTEKESRTRSLRKLQSGRLEQPRLGGRGTTHHTLVEVEVFPDKDREVTINSSLPWEISPVVLVRVETKHPWSTPRARREVVRLPTSLSPVLHSNPV